MSHKQRVERHIIVDILASVLGGSLIAFLLNHSFVFLMLAAAAGLVLYLLEREHIAEEDYLEVEANRVVEDFPEGYVISEENMEILRKKANIKYTQNLTVEESAPYLAGLIDGAGMTAQWLIKEVSNG